MRVRPNNVPQILDMEVEDLSVSPCWLLVLLLSHLERILIYRGPLL